MCWIWTPVQGGVVSNTWKGDQPFTLKNHFDRPIKSYSCGSVAERSKALDLGSSLFGGVGSNPTTAR